MYFKTASAFFILVSCIFYSGWSQINIPPVVTAIGDQFYCPLSQINIVTDFNIVDPDDTEIEAIYIQISSGYSSINDRLILTGSHPNISSTWNINEGKLTIKSSTNPLIDYIAIIAAVKDVVFESSLVAISGEKVFSITLGDANYLSSTDHYYEYVSDLGITWTKAKTEAEGRTYFGLQGYLATLVTDDEAQFAGKQVSGAGWIGGSDAESEGIWKWRTGPEAGTVFWNGLANGSSPNYANWNTNEPNQFGDEDYAHITAPGIGAAGSWNDLSNTGELSGSYQPKGYIVEYGGMPGDPVIYISGSTKITIASIENVSDTDRCGAGSLTLSATATAGNVLWYDALENGNLLYTGTAFTTPILTASTTYYVLASENGCLNGLRTPVDATINLLPNIVFNVDFKNCDEDGLADGFTDFNLNEINDVITMGDSSLMVSYHSSFMNADNFTNTIAPMPFNNATANVVYARVTNAIGCYNVATVNLDVSTTSFPVGYIGEELSVCDDDSITDGLHIFDLSLATTAFLSEFTSGQNLSVYYYKSLNDALLEQNQLPVNYTNETPGNQEIYVRVESDDNSNCYGLGPYLTLKVNDLPEFETDSEVILCKDSSVVLRIYDTKGTYTYQWTNEAGQPLGSNSSLSVDTPGSYTVIATSTLNCMAIPKTVVVKGSSPAVLSIADINITTGTSNNSVEINNDDHNLGLGDYEFSLDNAFGPYQDAAFFDNVSSGFHVLYVNDKNGCGLSKIEIGVIGFPKFFSPNNDHVNDKWQVVGVKPEQFPVSSLHIFDRYGKLVVKLNPYSNGWDGMYNNKLLPASDYWFVLQLIDSEGNMHKRNGNFSLVR